MSRVKRKRHFEKEISDRYVVDKLLGEGGFCVVFKAKDKTTGRKVAIKRMDKTKTLYRKFQSSKAMERLDKLMYREAEVMRSLIHINISRLLDFIDDGKHIYLILEFAEGGELYSRLLKAKRFQESMVISIIKQIINGVNFMHENGFVHRDIKAENILFREKNSLHVMITDFGLSKYTEGPLFTNCGTLVYSAPEMLKNKKNKCGYDKMIDNWAIGVLTYLLLCGHLPFDDPQQNENKIVQKILNGKVSFPYTEWNKINAYAKRFILRFLEVNPTKRMTLNEALRHRFIIPFKDNPLKSSFQYSVDRQTIEEKSMNLFPMMETSHLQTLARIRWEVIIYLSITIIYLNFNVQSTNI